jgi:single-strand DNA-binding protein
MTTIAIRGNTTAPVELRFTSSGRAVASVTVAENTGKEDQKKTHFHDVTLWGELAENAAQLDKGTSVIVVGRLEQEEYTDREGRTRRAWKVTADAFGPDLRFQTVTVTRAGSRQPANVGAPQPDSWSGGFGDDSPF